MPVINNLTATTELEAVNAMLAVVGETPLDSNTDLATATSADVLMAIQVLRNIARDVLAMGWKFNTEFGFEIAPTAQFAWVDTAGVTTPLNIFTPPSKMIAFTPTLIPTQQGTRHVDSEIRPSRKYSVGTLVFYDRKRSRDGFPADLHPFLYINPVWLFDFEKLPESARRYITLRAAREFSQDSVGSDTLSAFAQRGEALALRTLQREQGIQDEYNWLGNVDGAQVYRGRPQWPSGINDSRRNRGPA